MTDKQIIINKMDKPKRYCEGIDCAWCNEKEPCIYKIANELEEKLLRKEQECEELKRDVERWKSNFNGKVSAIEELLQQLEQLKAEKQGLIKDWEEKKNLAYEIACKNGKLERTLTEIKEVAKSFCNACQEFEPEKGKNCINCTYCNYNKILQKISEVEK